MMKPPRGYAVPRIEALRVKRYRALADLDLRGMTPLTAFLGPNGSGKSTIFDVFAFLSECFTSGLRKAWDRRGRFKELRTRGVKGRIEIELKYREAPSKPVITYHLSIGAGTKRPFIFDGWLAWKRGQYGKAFRFLDFHRGEGRVVSGEIPDEQEERIRLSSPDTIAVNTLGQLAKHPRVTALRQFVTG